MQRVRPVLLLTIMITACGLLTAGCSGGSSAGTSPEPAGTATNPAAVTTTAAIPPSVPSSTASATTSTGSVAGRAAGTGPSAADTAAGLLSRTVVQTGSGRLRVVKGKAKAPRGGKVVRVRVEVERGLKVDAPAFAAFVLATLNDPRSWTHDGYTFARTDGGYDVRVVLASPDTSARMCRPLITYGKLSCGTGSTAVLTMYRWIKAIPEYRGNPTGYRHYVVNHEVGHTLGHHHEYCAGKGRLAPVMMQQTKGLLGCRPNPWPHP